MQRSLAAAILLCVSALLAPRHVLAVPVVTDSVVPDLVGDSDDAAHISSGNVDGTYRIGTDEVPVLQIQTDVPAPDAEQRPGDQGIQPDVADITAADRLANYDGDSAAGSVIPNRPQDRLTDPGDYAAAFALHDTFDRTA